MAAQPVSFDLAEPLKTVGTPIEQVPELRPYRGVLTSLGYVTLEHLMYSLDLTGNELSAVLKTDLSSLISQVDIPATAIPPDELQALTEAQYSLGFAIESLTPPESAPSFLAATPPPTIGATVSLISDMPPIRNQGERGTCVAHAALAVFEHGKARSHQYEDMSEQFLYWNCKQNDRRPDSPGTWLRIAVPLLERDGCCKETTWPYNPATIQGNEAQGPPPTQAQLEALGYRTGMYNQIAPTSVTDIKSELAQNRAVAFSVPVFKSWYASAWVRYSGDIVLPLPNEVRIGGHAMCLAGYIDTPDKPELGGGKFILRNSWGEGWGSHCPYGKGYGTIPYSYITRYCLEAYSIPSMAP